jgi:predicted nucleotidyltransferase
MNVTGDSDAYASALDVEIEPGFHVRIVSLPAMAVLKILAWNDRPERDKHASDVLLILRNYCEAGQFERLYAEGIDLLETYGHDLELAGAALLGRDARRDITKDTRTQVINVFKVEKNLERFSAQMTRSNRGDVDRAALFLEAFLEAIREEAISKE